MESPSFPFDENERLKELERLRAMELILDKTFRNFTLMSAMICDTPAAAISLIDSDRQWFRVPVGIELQFTPRSISFCGHTILQNDALIINNAHHDTRFYNNPLVCSAPAISFYAGVPLMTAKGHNLGTLCVFDYEERSLEPEMISMLKLLAQQIVIQLEEAVAGARYRVTLNRLRSFMDHMNFAVLIEDRQGGAVLSNQPFHEYFGFPDPPTWKGHRSLLEVLQLPICERGVFDAWLQNTLEKRVECLGKEIRLIDGRILEVDFIPNRDEFTYEGQIWTFRDITQQREQEKQSECQRVQMALTRKLAAMGEMAAGLAHEINNPLAIIHGKAFHLRQLCLKENMQAHHVIEATDSIEMTTMRIARVTRGLRSFAQETDYEAFEKEQLSKIIDDALVFCQERFKNYQVELIIDPFDSQLMLICRPSQISQALLNLFNNAFDACYAQLDRKKWIRLTIEQEPHLLRLTVSDSGPGVPADIRDKIMQPFFTTKEPGRGTGLGLSASRGIIESHKGTLFYDAEAPVTRFVIELRI